MDAVYGLRKFVAFLLIAALAAVLTWFGKISGSVGAELLGFDLATYFGANVWTKYATKGTANGDS